MTNTTFPEQHDQTMTVEIERAGRRFSPARGAVAPPQVRVRTLHQRPEDVGLPNALCEAILGRLAWSSLRPEESDRQTLVQAYINSLNQLAEFRRDVETMVRTACVASLEFRQAKGETHVAARDTVLAAKLNEMLAQAACDWLPLRNVLDAKLVSRDVPTLRTELNTALSAAVADFTRQFFELLAKLVDRELFGLVEWLPNHCCSYHFFKRVVIQENEGASQRIVESMFDDLEPLGPIDESHYSTPPRIVGRRISEDVLGKGKHYHRIARHEHSVMNAICTSVRNSQVTMPPQVVPLIEKIPDWLYPFVQVIDGDIFRERIIERDTQVEEWVDSVEVRDEPIYGTEPGVIIGPFVLTGWGPREVGEEQSRRHKIQDAAAQQANVTTAQRRAPWLVAGAVVLSLVALLLLVRWLQGSGNLLFAILAIAAAIATVWQAAFDFATARRNPTALLAAHCATVSIACQMLLAGWLVVRWFQPVSWLTPVALGIAAVLAHVFGRRFQ